MKKKLFYISIMLLLSCGLYSQTPVELKEISYGWVNPYTSWQIGGYIYLDQPTTITFYTNINGDLERNQSASFFLGNGTYIRDKSSRTQDITVTLGQGRHWINVKMDYKGYYSATVATLRILKAVPGPLGTACYISTL